MNKIFKSGRVLLQKSSYAPRSANAWELRIATFDGPLIINLREFPINEEDLGRLDRAQLSQALGVFAKELGHERRGPVVLDEAVRKFELAGKCAWAKDGQIVDATSAITAGALDSPKIAEFLLTMILQSSRADAVIGDLNEYFTRECKEFGRDRAVRLYWARTLRSLWPLLRRAIGKALKWGAVIATMRRLF